MVCILSPLPFPFYFLGGLSNEDIASGGYRR